MHKLFLNFILLIILTVPSLFSVKLVNHNKNALFLDSYNNNLVLKQFGNKNGHLLIKNQDTLDYKIIDMEQIQLTSLVIGLIIKPISENLAINYRVEFFMTDMNNKSLYIVPTQLDLKKIFNNELNSNSKLEFVGKTKNDILLRIENYTIKFSLNPNPSDGEGFILVLKEVYSLEWTQPTLIWSEK